MRGWKRKKKAIAEIKVESTGLPVDGETAKRAAAKRARQIAGRRAKRLVGAWRKATDGWKRDDAISELDSRVAKGIRAVTRVEADGAKQARQNASRRSRRLIAAWSKATDGWAPEDSIAELEARVAQAIRKAMG